MMKDKMEKVENNSLVLESEEFEEISLENSVKDFGDLFNNMSEWYHERVKKDMIAGNSEIIRTRTIKSLIENYEKITEKYSKEEIVSCLSESLTNEQIYVGKYGGKEIYSTLSEEIFTTSATFARYIINKIELDNNTRNKDLIKGYLESLYPFLDSKTKKECEKFLDKKLVNSFDNFEEELKDLSSITKDFTNLRNKLEEVYYDELLGSNLLNREDAIKRIEKIYENHLEKYPGDLDDYSIGKDLRHEMNSISFAIYKEINEINKKSYQSYDYCLGLNERFLHEKLRRIAINYLNSIHNQDRFAKLQKQIEGLRNQLKQTKEEINKNKSSWTAGWIGRGKQILSDLKRKAESLEKEIKRLESQLQVNNKLEANIKIVSIK